jgi:hypothetical protein
MAAEFEFDIAQCSKKKRLNTVLSRLNSGAGERSRTPDLRITNALLYQLSYTSKNKILTRDKIAPD